jgi:hypothetical protein
MRNPAYSQRVKTSVLSWTLPCGYLQPVVSAEPCLGGYMQPVVPAEPWQVVTYNQWSLLNPAYWLPTASDLPSTLPSGYLQLVISAEPCLVVSYNQ